jgi:ribosomal protein S25
MIEIWKAVPGFEGQYEVSDQGRVRSLDRIVLRRYANGRPATPISYKGKVISTQRKNCGHIKVNLGAGVHRLVHRLVMCAFVGAPGAGQECLHNNGIPNDNRKENLRWGTRVENKNDERRHAQEYGRKQGVSHLTEDTIRAIKKDLTDPNRPSQKVLAKKYGVHYNTINNISRCFTHRWISV